MKIKNFENEKNKKIKEWGSHRFCVVKVGWGGSVEEERVSDKETLRKRIIIHTKPQNEETKQRQRNERKTRRVCQRNERYADK